MTKSSVVTDLIGEQVYVPNIDERDQQEFDPRLATVRVVFYGTGGLKAIVQYHEEGDFPLEEVKVTDLTIAKKEIKVQHAREFYEKRQG